MCWFQREMESARSLVASIEPFSMAQFGRHRPSSGWWARHAAEAATGFKEKSGWMGLPMHSPLTQGARAQNETGEEIITHDSIFAGAADSFSRRWATP